MGIARRNLHIDVVSRKYDQLLLGGTDRRYALGQWIGWIFCVFRGCARTI